MRKQLFVAILVCVFIVSSFTFSACHKHSTDEWISISAPNCTDDGLKVGVCSCGEELTEVTPAIGHDYQNGTCLKCGHKVSVGLEYFNYADYCIVTGIGECTDINVVIPSIHNGLPVKGIDAEAFCGCKTIEGITIPKSVSKIDNLAFYYCENLLNVTIEGSPFICSAAFEGTAYYNNPDNWQNDVLYIGKCLIKAKREISSCTIKPDTTVIATQSFSFCKEIRSITVPESVEIICDYAFADAENLTSITIQGNPQFGTEVFRNSGYFRRTKNWQDGMLYLGNYLVKVDPSVKNCTIKESTTHILADAFSSCNQLKNITIPASVTYIGDSPFYLCTELLSIDVASGNKNYQSINGVLYTKDGKTLIQYPAGKYAEKFVIPSSVQVIADGAFADADCLDIEFHDGIKHIGSYAFFQSSIQSLVIPTKITRIEYGTFRLCSNLFDVTIPANVKYIREYAFKGSDHIDVTFADKDGWYCILGVTNGIKDIYQLPINDSPMSIDTYLNKTYSDYDWIKK